MRNEAGVGDSVERTGDGQAQVVYLVAGQSSGRVTLCTVCTVHKVMRSTGFLVQPQNHSLGFPSLGLKTGNCDLNLGHRMVFKKEFDSTPVHPPPPRLPPSVLHPSFHVLDHGDVKGGLAALLWFAPLILLSLAIPHTFWLDHPRRSFLSYENLLTLGQLSLRWSNQDLLPIELGHVHVHREWVFVEFI
jgi:hypothetical protein